MRSTNDADVAVPMTLDGDGKSSELSTTTQDTANAQPPKVNVANGQLTTSIKIEPTEEGGRSIKVAPPVVTITGNDEM